MKVDSKVALLYAVALQASLGMSQGYAQVPASSMTREQAHLEAVDCQSHPYSFEVTVKDVRTSEGTITLDLHDGDPEAFLRSGTRLDRIRVPASEGDMVVCIPVDGPGVYAFALYHDEDADKKFDKNFIGLPAEPFGLSNDPRIRLARPKHEECAFEVTGRMTPVATTLHH